MNFYQPKTVYLATSGIKVNTSGPHFSFTGITPKPIRMPIIQVRQFIASQSVAFTQKAIQATLAADIPVTFIDGHGAIKGHLRGPDRHDASIRLAQYEAWRDADTRRMVARRFVEQKLAQAERTLITFRKNHPAVEIQPALSRIRTMRLALPEADDLDTIRGCEGMAARCYFQVLGNMFLRNFHFPGRVRNPPTDPVNALLSYCYSILTREIAIHLEAVGLDAYVGFLHDIKSGRPSLALDLLEPWRPAIADRLALRLINREQLQPSHFRNCEDGNGVYLTPDGRRVFFAEYEKMMRECEMDPDDGKYRSPRQLVEAHVESYKTALKKGTLEQWCGVTNQQQVTHAKAR